MRAINHALTGAIIGLTVNEPIIALPAALASHFVMDALPHFHIVMPKNGWVKTNSFRYSIYIDAVLCFFLVLILGITQPTGWQLAAVCAFVATSPDLASINYYSKVKSGKKWRPNLYEKFSNKIQWFERPIGAVVEVAWLVTGIVLLTTFLRVG